MTDFGFANHGSLCLLTPISEPASEWVDQHLPEDALRWGACSIVIEPRYVAPILNAIIEDGMTVNGGV